MWKPFDQPKFLDNVEQVRTLSFSTRGIGGGYCPWLKEYWYRASSQTESYFFLHINLLIVIQTFVYARKLQICKYCSNRTNNLAL